jgi:hypothetical protein
MSRAAERLAGFAEAYVVLEGDNSLRAAKDLRGLLGVERNGAAASAAGADEDDFDDEDEDEDDLEDEDDES